MTSGKGCAEDAVCLAVCVGWRMAELYNRKELPGPPRRRDPDDLPGHLPGFGEMSGHEKSCALAVVRSLPDGESETTRPSPVPPLRHPSRGRRGPAHQSKFS
jgi:hypothetical protein